MTEPTPARAASTTPRTRAQIEADLAATRQRLVSSIEQLIDQVHPQRVKERQIQSVKTFTRAEIANARSQVFYPNGELRTFRLAAVGGAVAGFATFVLVLRKILRSGRSKDRTTDTDRRRINATSRDSCRDKSTDKGKK